MEALLRLKDITDWLLFKFNQPITPKKLQKMLYYEYSWFLAILNNGNEKNLKQTLFKAQFQAWIHGPVIPKLYKKTRQLGYDDSGDHNIKNTQDSNLIGLRVNKTTSHRILNNMNIIFNTYKRLTGSQLSYMTHHDAPWKKARGRLKPFTPSHRPLNNKVICSYYAKLLGVKP